MKWVQLFNSLNILWDWHEKWPFPVLWLLLSFSNLLTNLQSTNSLALSLLYAMNFQMFKLDLEKVEEPEIELPISIGSWNKQESSREISTSALLTMPKPLTVWITTNCGKFWMRWEYQTTWPTSWETCIQVRKQQLDLDMEQQTGSK